MAALLFRRNRGVGFSLRRAFSPTFHFSILLPGTVGCFKNTPLVAGSSRQLLTIGLRSEARRDRKKSA